MQRQWAYAKDMLRIKPEYLLTVSVADSIIKGFGGNDPLQIELRLEASTSRVHRDFILDEVGWKNYFSATHGRISRKGRVDICVRTPVGSHLVELKNIDPPDQKVIEELHRLGEFLLVNSGNNSCRSCHIAYPLSRTTPKSVRRLVTTNIDSRLKFSIQRSARVITGEEPEDGLPAFHPICISMTRK